MGLYRTFARWKMATPKFLYQHTVLFCVVLGTCLITLSYLNSRLNLSLSYWREYSEKSVIFQEDLRPPRLRHAVRHETLKECPIFTLRDNSDRTQIEILEQTACQRIPPLPGSCSLAENIFFSKPQARCSHQSAYNFCELKMSNKGTWEVMCNETMTTTSCSSPLSVGRIDEHTGALAWEDSGTPLQTSKILTTYIRGSNLTYSVKLYGFCFIRCLLKHPILYESAAEFGYGEDDRFYNQDEERIYAEQLLVLPPQFNQASPGMKPSPGHFSVNILLVDSVSRQHFFRSLPKSVSALKEIMASSVSRTTVLDFELVQAVRSRTFETLQTIFSGDIDPLEKPFGTLEMPPCPLNLSFMFKKFKKKNFHTLWIEDLCYLWEWGISKDLHFLNKSSGSKETWFRMWKKLSENFVDSVEVTLAMCKVLKENGVADHFHGPDSVCFNGRHQHEYLLEYIQLYQQTLESRKEVYFSFTMTNVAHEGSGRRIQTLDNSLARYLKFSASLKNTFTVVFSDHGNSYGKFMRATQEARIELFHPFMIFIIPKDVASVLGGEAIESLRTNTLRLVSFLDLHHTLNYIISRDKSSQRVKGPFQVSRKGLFIPVDVNRTCDDIPRIMPNLCICVGYDTPYANSTANILFAYFAIGRLNDEIQRQLSVSRVQNSILASREDIAAFRKCQRLTLTSVQNVRISFEQNKTQTLKMDLHVQQSQVFFVALSVKHNLHGQGDHNTEIEMYDRITPYSKYSVCADKIDLSLCICDTSQTSAHSIPELNIPQENDFRNLNLLSNFEAIVQSINTADQCLLLVTVKHSVGGVILAANSCPDKSFILNAALDVEDKILYYQRLKLPVLLPGGVVVVGLLYAENGDSWESSVKVSYQVVVGERGSMLGT